MKRKAVVCLIVPLTALSLSDTMWAQAEEPEHVVAFDVTVTNITEGQTFSPFVVATHQRGLKLFHLAQPARPELAFLAETGDPRPLAGALAALPEVLDITLHDALLAPGESATVRVRVAKEFHRLSVAGMLLVTNDGFFAANGVRAPRVKDAFFSPGYDAGSEVNDELCSSIPGEFCGGNGGDDENGVVHIHSGIHGVGDLSEHRFDWRNPVARIRIVRVQENTEAATGIPR